MRSLNDLRLLLDPLDGDIADHADRRWRINLRRTELTAIALIADASVEVAFSFVRHSPGLRALCLLAICGAFATIVMARHAQRTDDSKLIYLPEVFAVFALLCSQAAGYFVVATSGRIPTGFAMVFLAFAVFFQMPPRRFAIIGLSTLAVFGVWTFLLDVSLLDKLAANFNTALAIVAGIFGRQGLDRLQEVDRSQRLQINQQNAELTKANKELADRNAEQNELMAIAAHDLRSPLFGLNNLLALASQRLPSTDLATRDVLFQAGNAITDMIRLVGRLLDAHEAESRSITQSAPTDLLEALIAVANRMSRIARANGIELVVTSQSTATVVETDPDALEQVLENIISNAIRFSPKGSIVELTAAVRGVPLVEVADRGAGITAEERQHLFHKFARGVRKPLHGPRGSGLGLYIAATLAGAMSATISHHPRDGGGSIFRLKFDR